MTDGRLIGKQIEKEGSESDDGMGPLASSLKSTVFVHA